MLKKIISFAGVLYLGTMLSPVLASEEKYRPILDALQPQGPKEQFLISLVGSVEDVLHTAIQVTGSDGREVLFVPAPSIQAIVTRDCYKARKDFTDAMIAAGYSEDVATVDLTVLIPSIMAKLRRLEAEKA